SPRRGAATAARGTARLPPAGATRAGAASPRSTPPPLRPALRPRPAASGADRRGARRGDSRGPDRRPRAPAARSAPRASRRRPRRVRISEHGGSRISARAAPLPAQAGAFRELAELLRLFLGEGFGGDDADLDVLIAAAAALREPLPRDAEPGTGVRPGRDAEPVALEEAVGLDAESDDHISGRTAADASLSLSGKADLGAGLHAGGHGQGDGTLFPVLAASATCAAGVAGDLAAPVACGARPV